MARYPKKGQDPIKYIYTDEDIEADPCIQTWCESLAERRGDDELTIDAKRKCIRVGKIMATALGKPVSDIIDECFENDRKPTDQIKPSLRKRNPNYAMLKKVKEWCSKNLEGSLNYHNKIAFASCRGLMAKNGINVDGWVIPIETASKVSSSKFNVDLYTPDAENPTKTYFTGRPIVQKFVRYFSPRNEFLTAGMLSSSVDIGLFLKMSIKDFTDNIKDDRFFWFDGLRERTRERFDTFFSREATQMGLNYIKNERKTTAHGEKIPDNWPLIGPSKYYGKRHPKEGKEILMVRDEGAPLKTNTISEEFRTHYCDTFKIKIPSEEQQPFRPKAWRGFFVESGKAAKIPNKTVDRFMGHKPKEINYTYEKSRNELLPWYNEIEPYVTIWPNDPIGDSEKFKELQELVKTAGLDNSKLQQMSQLQTQQLVDSEKPI